MILVIPIGLHHTPANNHEHSFHGKVTRGMLEKIFTPNKNTGTWPSAQTTP